MSKLRQHPSPPRDTSAVTRVTAGELKGDFAHYQRLLALDLLKIKEIGAIDEKAKAKRAILENYAPFIGQYLDSGACYPNPVAVQVMIWAFDVGLELLDTASIGRAVELGLILTRQKCHHLPKGFSRGIETFICDCIYDWSEKQLRGKQSASPYLNHVCALIDGWLVSELTAGKVYAMTAKHCYHAEQWTECVLWADKAELINPNKAGVKGIRKAAHDNLLRLAAQAKNPPSPASNGE